MTNCELKHAIRLGRPIVAARYSGVLPNCLRGPADGGDASITAAVWELSEDTLRGHSPRPVAGEDLRHASLKLLELACPDPTWPPRAQVPVVDISQDHDLEARARELHAALDGMLGGCFVLPSSPRPHRCRV